jgi:hypothetical protein
MVYSKHHKISNYGFIHLYTNNIQVDWTPIEPIVKNIRIEKNQFYIITKT